MYSRLLVLYLTLSLSSYGDILKVCASGCAYTTWISAYNAAVGGDIIELAAGETFVTTANPTFKKWATRPIITRSSKWMELPPAGYRIDPVRHSSLMPTLEPSDPNTAIIKMGFISDFLDISSVDTALNTLTLSGSPGANGDVIACRPRFGPSAGVMPGGVNENQNYIVNGVSGNTLSLLEFQGGGVVDITSAGSGSRQCVPVQTARNLVFDGIRFITPSGVAVNSSLFQLGTGNEASYLGMPSGTTIRRSLFLGREFENGPRGGIAINSRGITVLDSYVDQIKFFSVDTNGIWGGTASVGITANRNYISSASINVLTGGQGTAINNSLVTKFKMDRNFMIKHGTYMYNQGSGAPSGACFTGRFYRDTAPSPNTCANGACYRCVASSWVQDLVAVYQNDDFLTKSMIEFKQCKECTVSRSVVKNGPQGPDTGNPGTCFMVSQVDTDLPWSNIQNSSFKDSWCDNTWRGISIGSDGGYVNANTGITVSNILMTDQANFPTMGIHANKGDVLSYPFRMDGGTTNSIITNVTSRYAAASPTGNFGFLLSLVSGGQMSGSYFRNNIGQQYGFLFVDGSDGTCGAGGLGNYVSSSTQIEYWLQDGPTTPPLYTGCTTNMTNVDPVPYVSSSNSRLQSGSPWSANCTGGSCQFMSTNGKDLGADIDLVESETAGVEDGNPGWLPGLTIKMGSTRGVVRWIRPANNSCDLTLYTDLGRVNEDADTNSAPNKADTRTGNIVNGREVQFLLGTVDPLTPSTTYAFKVNCSTDGIYRVGTLKTYPAASGEQKWGFSKGGASVTSQISSSPAMSSPTSIGANTNPRFVVPQGEVRYWQTTSAVQNGAIEIVVAR